MRILAISVGVSQLLVLSQNPLRTAQSAIHKTVVSELDRPERIELTLLGLQTDEQSDLSVHGGRDKALYAYPTEHWSRWQAEAGTQPRPGLLGENLAIEGLTEDSVYAGDRWLIGEAELQVTEPRIPCDKLCAALRWPQAARFMVASGVCGWYLRVVRPAPVAAGMAIEVQAGPRDQSMAQLFAFKTRR